MGNSIRKKVIKHSSPSVGKDEIIALRRVIERGILSTGEIVSRFESAIAKVVRTNFAVCTNSGSSALFLILKFLPKVFPELKGKDEVLIPSFACSALTNAVFLAGLKPVFADINQKNFSLDFQDVKKKITKKTLCIVFVHSFGIVSDISLFLDLGVPVVEGIAQSFGGTCTVEKYSDESYEDEKYSDYDVEKKRYSGKKTQESRVKKSLKRNLIGIGKGEKSGLVEIGNEEDNLGPGTIREGVGCERKYYAGSRGIASFTSFYATKVITTAEGGAVFTNERELAEKIKDAIDYDKKDYGKDDFRFNFKMSDISASIGLVQLRNLKCFIARRREIAKIYFKEFSDFALEGIISLPPEKNNIFFRYVVVLKKGGKEERDKVIDFMRRKGVMADIPIWRPLHYFYTNENLPITQEIYNTSVSIPIYPLMSDDDAFYTAQIFKKALCTFLQD